MIRRASVPILHPEARTLSIFKKGRKYGPTLLGVWLIAWGVLPMVGAVFPFPNLVLLLLAIAAGVLILIDR